VVIVNQSLSIIGRREVIDWRSIVDSQLALPGVLACSHCREPIIYGSTCQTVRARLPVERKRQGLFRYVAVRPLDLIARLLDLIARCETDAAMKWHTGTGARYDPRRGGTLRDHGDTVLWLRQTWCLHTLLHPELRCLLFIDAYSLDLILGAFVSWLVTRSIGAFHRSHWELYSPFLPYPLAWPIQFSSEPTDDREGRSSGWCFIVIYLLPTSAEMDGLSNGRMTAHIF